MIRGMPNQPLSLYRKDIIVAAALLPVPVCLSHCIFHMRSRHLMCNCLPMILVLVKDRFRKILESTVAAKGVDVCTVPDDYLNSSELSLPHVILKGGGPCRVAPPEILIFHNIGSGQMNPKIRCPRLIFRKCLGPVDHDDPTPK